MKNLRLIMVTILVSVAGVQSGQAAATDNESFMSLWSTYSHCRSTAGIEQLRADALNLTNAANRSRTQESFVLPLPGKLERFVAPPAARVAVDVKAMAADCSLRAAAAAVEVGKIDVAKDLLRPFISHQPQSEYGYYALQAKTLLSEIETSIDQVTPTLP